MVYKLLVAVTNVVSQRPERFQSLKKMDEVVG